MICLRVPQIDAIIVMTIIVYLRLPLFMQCPRATFSGLHAGDHQRLIVVPI